MIEMIPYGNRIRQNGQLVLTPAVSTRMIDFGHGPVRAMGLPWGDIFMAYYSTGIPNIEDFGVFSEEFSRGMNTINSLRPLFNLPFVRELFKRISPGGSTAEERAKTQTHVWGEVEDDQGRKLMSRLHGPEAGVTWTALLALAAVQKVLDGNAPPGFQTPSLVFGADFVLESERVKREDLQ